MTCGGVTLLVSSSNELSLFLLFNRRGCRVMRILSWMLFDVVDVGGPECPRPSGVLGAHVGRAW